MEYPERAWYEERGLAACRRSDHQHDCQHGQGEKYQHGNSGSYLQSLELWDLDVIELEPDEGRKNRE